ncbi:MAG: Hpt domain-containing protein [SAR324 cluster bacterium]|nr:Hpt domain-containing protein [SAR324 cluster bacterium]
MLRQILLMTCACLGLWLIAGCGNVDNTGVRDGHISLKNTARAYRLTGTWLLHSGNEAREIPDWNAGKWRSWQVPDGQITLTLDETEKYNSWLGLEFEINPGFEGHPMSLLIPVNGNYTVILNGQRLHEYRELGEIVQTGPTQFHFDARDLRPGKNMLLLEGTRLIGVSGPSPEIFLGLTDVVNTRYIFRWAWNAILTGVFVFLAFYHWQMFFKRRTAIAYFWFGCVLLSNAMWVLFNPYLAFSIFPENTWVWLLWWFTIPLTMLSYLPYFHYTFDYPVTRWTKMLVGIIAAWALIPASDLIFNDWTKWTFKLGLPVLGPVSLLFYIYTGVLLTRAIREKQVGASLMSLGMFVVIASSVNDQLMNMNVYQAPLLLGEGTLFFMICLTIAQANRFAAVHEALDRSHKIIEDYNRTLEQKVDERTRQLRQKTTDIQSMLQNMDQGILTVTEEMLIHPEYSRYLEEIFETNHVAGRDIMEFMFDRTDLGVDTRYSIETAIGACVGEHMANFIINSHIFPLEMVYILPEGRNKYLELSWGPICDEDEFIEKILICVRDVTEIRKLREQAGQQKRDLEIISHILGVSQEKIFEFFTSAHEFLEENRKLLTQTDHKDGEVLDLLFRNMHTIKGNARTYALLFITNVVHEAEQTYDELRRNPDSVWNPEQLLAQLAEVRRIIEDYEQINIKKLGRKGPGRRGDAERFFMVEKEKIKQALLTIQQTNHDDLIALQALVRELNTTLSLIGTTTVRDAISGVLDSLPSLAQELGKQPPAIHIQSEGVYIKNQITGLLRNVFMHIFRNSLDHGIESHDSRKANSKSAQGNISLQCSVEGDLLVFRYQDDGAGLNIKRLREKGIENQSLPPDGGTRQAVAELIFHSGLSTAEKVSEISGRGVGMDAVKNFIEREQGTVKIEFTGQTEGDYQTFAFVLTFPAKFAVNIG